MHISRSARKEKEPPIPLPTLLGQLLQIQHLPDRAPPKRQEMFMEMVFYSPTQISTAPQPTPQKNTSAQLTCMARPRLKTRRIPRHRGEVAIMQPVDNPLFLRHPRPPLSIIDPKLMRPQRHPRPLVRRLAVIRLHKPTADEQDIADLDIAALCLRMDIDALVFAAVVQLFERDGVVVVGVVLDAFSVRVGAVVEEDAAAGDAVLGPVVDGAFVVRFRSEDVGAVRVVVEGAGCEVGELGAVSVVLEG